MNLTIKITIASLMILAVMVIVKKQQKQEKPMKKVFIPPVFRHVVETIEPRNFQS